MLKIGDIVSLEGSLGKIIDETNEYFGVVFQDIYLEDRPFWALEEELEKIEDKETIKKVNDWYKANEEEINQDIEECNNDEDERW